MDKMVLGEQDLEVDIEAGLSDVVTQESTSDFVSANTDVWSEREMRTHAEKIVDDLSYPLMGEENPVDLLEKKCDNVNFKKSRKASKPPRPPKGPTFSASDRKVMREIAELAMRKRARIERMKISLRRIKAAKSSSSPCINFFSMIVTVLFFFFLVFQGFFAGNSSLRSEKSPAPIGSPNNQMISVQFYNEFAPIEQTDPSPTTSFRYTRKRFSGAEEDGDSRHVTR